MPKRKDFYRNLKCWRIDVILWLSSGFKRHVRGFFASQKASNDVCNAACCERISVNQLWDALRTAAQSDLKAIHGPDRQGDVRDSLADVSKAERLLGYQPEYTVKEGLEMTWNAFK